ncbi:MAG: peptidoglycan-associated lipoprotein Pal [Rhodobacteraceae bacterium]|jgi:peptidoglycan-associated lipoprotein|uniref:peptidoglycan-associated lipoprotein Pal n=1 Tax=Roseobacteraceae TaxID=2854170 RepID=UPI001938ECB2|nr:peptidoglycan-associated lipoprotein Pal [Roseovarius sp. 10]MBE1289140.1 peptidoglycan-associated lipoprotein Pal [Paracoccaceae bacterium]MBF9056837.1 peptidoglycan-associated lipoprotein Pal [Rhodobacterales bacterium HKCCA1065]MDV7200974.1 peptidoglycan-associated lipoprotein Pal [Roseovarius sp. 10]QPI85178.1 peptidoglycan-associated lipoprotein Pal [Rhodobacterales bacterium HKCCA1288]
MKLLVKSTLMVAMLGLAACSQAGLGGNGASGQYGAGAGGNYDPASPEYFNQTIGDRVFFAVDQSNLSAEAIATLDQQANWLLSNPNYTAIIEGHADEQGTREYNLALGARRAASAQEYLISRGVAPNRLSTISYGKERPIEICSNEACYSRNRRAVTVIAAGAGA